MAAAPAAPAAQPVVQAGLRSFAAPVINDANRMTSATMRFWWNTLSTSLNELQSQILGRATALSKQRAKIEREILSRMRNVARAIASPRLNSAIAELQNLYDDADYPTGAGEQNIERSRQLRDAIKALQDVRERLTLTPVWQAWLNHVDGDNLQNIQADDTLANLAFARWINRNVDDINNFPDPAGASSVNGRQADPKLRDMIQKLRRRTWGKDDEKELQTILNSVINIVGAYKTLSDQIAMNNNADDISGVLEDLPCPHMVSITLAELEHILNVKQTSMQIELYAGQLESRLDAIREHHERHQYRSSALSSAIAGAVNEIQNPEITQALTSLALQCDILTAMSSTSEYILQKFYQDHRTQWLISSTELMGLELDETRMKKFREEWATQGTYVTHRQMMRVALPQRDELIALGKRWKADTSCYIEAITTGDSACTDDPCKKLMTDLNVMQKLVGELSRTFRIYRWDGIPRQYTWLLKWGAGTGKTLGVLRMMYTLFRDLMSNLVHEKTAGGRVVCPVQLDTAFNNCAPTFKVVILAPSRTDANTFVNEIRTNWHVITEMTEDRYIQQLQSSSDPVGLAVGSLGPYLKLVILPGSRESDTSHVVTYRYRVDVLDPVSKKYMATKILLTLLGGIAHQQLPVELEKADILIMDEAHKQFGKSAGAVFESMSFAEEVIVNRTKDESRPLVFIPMTATPGLVPLGRNSEYRSVEQICRILSANRSPVMRRTQPPIRDLVSHEVNMSRWLQPPGQEDEETMTVGEIARWTKNGMDNFVRDFAGISIDWELRDALEYSCYYPAMRLSTADMLKGTMNENWVSLYDEVFDKDGDHVPSMQQVISQTDSMEHPMVYMPQLRCVPGSDIAASTCVLVQDSPEMSDLKRVKLDGLVKSGNWDAIPPIQITCSYNADDLDTHLIETLDDVRRHTLLNRKNSAPTTKTRALTNLLFRFDGHLLKREAHTAKFNERTLVFVESEKNGDGMAARQLALYLSDRAVRATTTNNTVATYRIFLILDPTQPRLAPYADMVPTDATKSQFLSEVEQLVNEHNASVAAAFGTEKKAKVLAVLAKEFHVPALQRLKAFVGATVSHMKQHVPTLKKLQRLAAYTSNPDPQTDIDKVYGAATISGTVKELGEHHKFSDPVDRMITLLENSISDVDNDDIDTDTIISFADATTQIFNRAGTVAMAEWIRAQKPLDPAAQHPSFPHIANLLDVFTELAKSSEADENRITLRTPVDIATESALNRNNATVEQAIVWAATVIETVKSDKKEGKQTMVTMPNTNPVEFTAWAVATSSIRNQIPAFDATEINNALDNDFFEWATTQFMWVYALDQINIQWRKRELANQNFRDHVFSAVCAENSPIDVTIIDSSYAVGINFKGINNLIAMSPPSSYDLFMQLKGRLQRNRAMCGRTPAAARRIRCFILCGVIMGLGSRLAETTAYDDLVRQSESGVLQDCHSILEETGISRTLIRAMKTLGADDEESMTQHETTLARLHDDQGMITIVKDANNPAAEEKLMKALMKLETDKNPKRQKAHSHLQRLSGMFAHMEKAVEDMTKTNAMSKDKSDLKRIMAIVEYFHEIRKSGAMTSEGLVILRNVLQNACSVIPANRVSSSDDDGLLTRGEVASQARFVADYDPIDIKRWFTFWFDATLQPRGDKGNPQVAKDIQKEECKMAFRIRPASNLTELWRYMCKITNQPDHTLIAFSMVTGSWGDLYANIFNPMQSDQIRDSPVLSDSLKDALKRIRDDVHSPTHTLDAINVAYGMAYGIFQNYRDSSELLTWKEDLLKTDPVSYFRGVLDRWTQPQPAAAIPLQSHSKTNTVLWRETPMESGAFTLYRLQNPIPSNNQWKGLQALPKFGSALESAVKLELQGDLLQWAWDMTLTNVTGEFATSSQRFATTPKPN